MEINTGLLAFFAKKEVAVFVVVPEEDLGEDGRAEDVIKEENMDLTLFV